MINTVDGKILKKGDIGYEIGVDMYTGIYIPIRYRPHVDQFTGNVYADYEKCLERCDEINNERKTKTSNP